MMMNQEPKDRGSIKWTSLMLPEHIEMLRNLWKEDERVEQGHMEEQQAAGIDFLLQHAMNGQIPVCIEMDGDVHEVVPLRFHRRSGELECRDIHGGRLLRLSRDEVTDVSM